jgi:sugar lactone lactonase YvrE
MTIEVHRVGDTTDRLGEGPLWDVAEAALYWVDSLGPCIHRLDPATGDLAEWPVPGVIGSLALRAGGGAVIALETGLHLFDFKTGAAQPLADPEAGQPLTRFNDGKVDRQGRFVVGSMVRDRDKREMALGTLYRLDPDRTLSVLDTGIQVSNGPCFSPDGATLYFSDSPRRKIFAYPYDTATGAVGERRTFIDTESLDTAPDGGTVDSEGFVWSALVRSGQVGRFAPDGSLDQLIEIPARHPSSVMFGGPALDTLYVTTIADPLSDDYPGDQAGALFAVHGLGIKGLPEPRFTG